MNLRSTRNAPGIAVFVVCIFAFAGTGLSAQSGWANDEDWPRGDAIIAERFVIWAEEAMAAGQPEQAQIALERASDFADVSSDVSYLLAYVRARNNESRFLVLQALEKAIYVNRWRRYSEAQARLLQAEQLIALRRFYAALDSLYVYRMLAFETVDSSLMRLQALKGLALAGLDFPPTAMPIGPLASTLPVNMPGVSPPAALEFRHRLLETMDRNPQDPRPVRILFEFVRRRTPNYDDLALVEIALRRLPFLLDADPELAWMAVPFIGNLEEARRLILAYRAGSHGSGQGFAPNPASIVPALNLGLLDDMVAVEEFFAPDLGGRALDKDLIIAVGDLLRGNEGRDAFAERLHSFTGTVTWDENGDGIPETRAVFRNGVLQTFYHDADQDGLNDWTIAFDTNLPQRGELLAMPEARAHPYDDSLVQALVVWSRYPSVQQVILRDETFIFAPGSFQYSPIGFSNIGASETFEGLLLPVRNHLSPGLTRRALVMSAVILERRSPEFPEGTERVYLRQGMPILSEVTEGGLLISVTEFENGFPMIQRVDLDRDGRMETVRRFHRGTHIIESSSSDWDGDGVFEYVELYREDGSIIRN